MTANNYGMGYKIAFHFFAPENEAEFIRDMNSRIERLTISPEPRSHKFKNGVSMLEDEIIQDKLC